MEQKKKQIVLYPSSSDTHSVLCQAVLYHTLVAPLPVQCYGLCSISISGVLKVMDNVEGNYRREYMHGKEWSMGERYWGWGAGSGCTVGLQKGTG